MSSVGTMSILRISDASELLGVSDDTVRRWIDSGRLSSSTDDHGKQCVEGLDIAHLLQEMSNEHGEDLPPQSVRNRLRGIVTRVETDKVMAQVELQCAGHRIVSLMSREAAEELKLQPGMVAVAGIKATNVFVELPGE